MRLLLDEGFPSPPGFELATVDATVEATTLQSFDPDLAGSSTPDWYLYLRAHEAGFDALVTRDWHQSEQVEEMWALSHTQLSIVTWRRGVNDPVRLWGQMLAYLPEIRRMIREHGPSIVLLPAVQLSKSNLEKASGRLGIVANDLGISTQEVRDEGQRLVTEQLESRGELHRFGDVLKRLR